MADGELQEKPIPERRKARAFRSSRWPAPPQGDSGAVAEAARMLVAAENPVIVADRVARTPAGWSCGRTCRDAAGAGDRSAGRMNFPSRHPLIRPSARRGARERRRDPGLGSERFLGHGQCLSRSAGTASREPITKPGTKLISITRDDLFIKSNYQDFQRYPEVDLAIAADAEATLPSLIEAVQAV